MRQKCFGAVLAVLAASMLLVGVAGAADYPQSTNEANQGTIYPHVIEVASGPGEVTLQFNAGASWAGYFELRIDGEDVVLDPTHPYLEDQDADEFLRPYVCAADPSDLGWASFCIPDGWVLTFEGNQTVEVRLAFGAERDGYFDWVTFVVGPSSADDCKKGGFADFGFSNQGQCLQFLRTR